MSALYLPVDDVGREDRVGRIGASGAERDQQGEERADVGETEITTHPGVHETSCVETRLPSAGGRRTAPPGHDKPDFRLDTLAPGAPGAGIAAVGSGSAAPDCSAEVVASAAFWQAAIAVSRAVPSGALSACLSTARTRCGPARMPSGRPTRPGSPRSRRCRRCRRRRGSIPRSSGRTRWSWTRWSTCRRSSTRWSTCPARRVVVAASARDQAAGKQPEQHDQPIALSHLISSGGGRAAGRHAGEAILRGRSVLEQRVAVLAALVGELGDRGHALVVVVLDLVEAAPRTRPAARVQKVSAM